MVGECSRSLSWKTPGWATGPEALAPPAGRNQASLGCRSPLPRIVLGSPEGPYRTGGWGHLGPGHPEETEGGCPQGQLRWQEQ